MTPTIQELQEALVIGKAREIESDLFWEILSKGYNEPNGQHALEDFKRDTGNTVDISNHGLKISVMKH
ncbi:hypothetical protein BH09VER1_BH09VER1_26010 [soil metagenome]